MGKAGFNDDALIDIAEAQLDDRVSSPSNPVSGQKSIFVKNDEFKQLNSSGTERFIGDKITVSANDASSGYLNGKLITSTGVTFTENNDGGNETLSIAVNNTVGSSRFAAAFGRLSTSTTVYLEYFRGISSNDSPLVIAENSQLAAISIACSILRTGTASIRKNGVEITTISLANQKTNNVNGLALSLVPGDQMSIYVSSGTFTDPVCTLFTKILL